jgi:hypothetical protein
LPNPFRTRFRKTRRPDRKWKWISSQAGSSSAGTKNLNPSPVEVQGRTLDVPDDPDTPAAEDPVDAELPGEGPENLSGPDDDDSLPD